MAVNLSSDSLAKEIVEEIRRIGRQASWRKVLAIDLDAAFKSPKALIDHEEVARACVYLCSRDGDYITGAELSINGGLFM